MKPEKMSDAIGELDEKIVEEADNARTEKKRKRSRKPLWISIGAAAACAGIVLGIGTMNVPPVGVTAAAQAVYPQMAQYPDEMSLTFEADYDKWWNDRKAQRGDVRGYADNLWDFYGDSTNTFLSGSEENRVYSPLNVYMALAMLAETTTGDSRQQILDLLSAEDIEALRSQAGKLWNANYCNDGAITSILGNSVWLDDCLDYDQNTLNRLAESYYASSYSGHFGSEELNTQLRDWLNDQTGGLLKNAVDEVELTPDTVLALYSTVLFKGKWDSQFNAANNDQKAFHAPGGDIETEFMNQIKTAGYFWGEDFGAIFLNFSSGCDMMLILPDEDKSIDDVLNSGEYMKLMQNPDEWENQKFLIVNYSVPKFDVSSSFNLYDGLTSLGITDVFSQYTADFCILAGNNSGVYLGEAKHSASVKIDEEGCVATAFTEMKNPGAGGGDFDEIDFVLDRPFLFVIRGMDGQPLFVGTVYNP